MKGRCNLKGKIPFLKVSTEEKAKPIKTQKIGRNDPCPCGSGKKYKKCCGRDLEDQKSLEG